MSDTGEFSRVVALDGGVNFRDLGGYVNNDGQRVKCNNP